MLFFDGLGVLILVVILIALPIVAFAVRRAVLARGGGTVELSVRIRPAARGRGWALGVGRYSGDELQWFRVFSLAPRPRRTLSRRNLVVEGRRHPHGQEALALQAGAVVLRCRNPTGEVEVAMSEPAVTGFLSWLESAPPGSSLPPLRAR